MKAIEIITEVNSLSPNQYRDETKLKWLEDLDGKIFHELIESCDDAETAARHAEADYTCTDVELLVGAPYGRDIYVNYLRGKIAEADAETDRYNLYAAAFNAEYQQYAALYSSRTPHRRQRGWRY